MATRFLALLRGINVGGRNVIPMTALRACFEELGCDDVRTYIQSGNVLFRVQRSGVRTLTRTIEHELSSRFDFPARVLVLARDRYEIAVRAAPPGWGRDTKRKHNALFTLAGATPRQILSQLPELRPKIETVAIGPGVLFWSASRRHLAKTTMMRLGRLPAYTQLTVRNHNTVRKLLEMLSDEA